jgi:hypothetical protein
MPHTVYPCWLSLNNCLLLKLEKMKGFRLWTYTKKSRIVAKTPGREIYLKSEKFGLKARNSRNLSEKFEYRVIIWGIHAL